MAGETERLRVVRARPEARTPAERKELLQKAIALDPQLVQAHFELGAIASTEGRWDEVLASYRKGLELNPGHTLYRNDLAWVLATCPDARLRNPAEAVELARRNVKESPQWAFWNTLGVAHYRAGDWAAARAALDEATRHGSGGFPGDWLFLAMTHWQLGEKEKARGWFEKAARAMDLWKSVPEEQARFRAEAAELLGLVDDKSKPTQPK